MKLHYSQTGCLVVGILLWVLIPYEITLLSNNTKHFICLSVVLIPYEITLLSNKMGLQIPTNMVLIPYEITLLSN